MRRAAVLPLVMAAFLGLARPADALTIRDVIELSKAGLGEDVLLALIEVDRGVYAMDMATLKALKDAGVSERVIVALIRSGRENPAPEPIVLQEVQDEPPPVPVPQVVVVEHHYPEPPPPVMVPVPVYITAPVQRRRRVQEPVESTYVPFQSGLPAQRPRVESPRPPPVYWGFGGKLRPDAWGPAEHKADAPKPEARGVDGQGERKPRP